MKKKLRSEEGNQKKGVTGKSNSTPGTVEEEVSAAATLEFWPPSPSASIGGPVPSLSSSRKPASLVGNMIARTNTNSNSKLKFKSKTSSVAVELEESVCKLCGKSFSSMKALFGHMRAHPERPYRGMNPPSSRSVPSSAPTGNVGHPEKIETTVDVDMVPAECMESTAGADGPATPPTIKSWVMEDKRGRREVPNSADDDDDDLSSMAIGLQAAATLMWMRTNKITIDEQGKLIKIIRGEFGLGRQGSDGELVKKPRKEEIAHGRVSKKLRLSADIFLEQ